MFKVIIEKNLVELKVKVCEFFWWCGVLGCIEKFWWRVMEVNEDWNEIDEVESYFEEESVFFELGFEELVCKYDVCVIF